MSTNNVRLSEASLRDLAAMVIETRRTLDRLGDATRIQTRRTSNATPVAVESRSRLSIGNVSTQTTLRSTGKITGPATAFGPTDPAFLNKKSTSSPTIGGTYDGSNGTTTLTFKVKRGGEVGKDDLQIEVRDASNRKLETIKFSKKNDPPGTVKTLSNGLTLSLSAGEVEKKDTFDVLVSVNQGQVDPNAAFNAIGTQSVVKAGSFTINGARISVAASDSISAVLDKINASSAGVDATFENATGEILLTQKTSGSQGQIVLGNDNTGFLAFTNLESATAVQGTDSERRAPIIEVQALSGIRKGTFSINGTEIAVDPTEDTLDDLLQRINVSTAGVQASFDAAEGKIRLRGRKPGQDLVLSDGDSKVFSGLRITPGEHKAKAVEAVVDRGFRGASALPTLFGDLEGDLRSLFDTRFDRGSSGRARQVIGMIKAAVTGAFEQVFGEAGTGRLGSGLGLDFDFGAKGGDVLQLDAGALRGASSDRLEEIERFLLADKQGSEGKGGLLVALGDTFDELGRSLADQLDPIANRSLRVNLTI